ncbi:MAG: SusD/RagB family nutrient-binding outer membrane lipoprotein [Bacteroidetes bacterium]|nr:SusD/RagB family nutrient-binding outer membrane lipoprotein [Bacteroidota bacterium]
MAAKNPITNYDVLFKGDMTKWLQFANTIKLRLLVRGNGKVTFANNSFDPAGFLNTNAMINPGYTRDNNRQNPAWNQWAFAYTGSAGQKSWVPTTWILSFYDGTNLADTKRGSATYYQFGVLSDFGAITGGSGYTNGFYSGVSLTGGNGSGAKADITVSGGAVTKVALSSGGAGSGYYPSDVLSAPASSIGGTGSNFSVAVKILPISNVLGFENVSAPKCPTGSRWYPGTDRGGTSAGSSTGPLKGPNAGFPVMIAAESYFLQAEAAVKGIIAGSASSLFNNGITAAFEYSYLKPDGTHSGDYAADASSYITANTASYLVNFSLATTADMQTEAIITQKYIALNFVNSHEGWNEYRRTGYPKVSGSAATTTFASIASQSTRPDKLPTRILYPNSEAQYNPANQPTGVSPFTSLIFWAK